MSHHFTTLESQRREFRKDGVPVHQVTSRTSGAELRSAVDIEGIRTLPLAELIEMKLRSGLTEVVRKKEARFVPWI